MSTTTIRDAAEVDLAPGQFWSLLRGTEIEGDIIDDRGYVTDTVYITDNAALTEIELAGGYVIRGDQDGDRFVVEALVEDDFPLVLMGGY